MKEVTIKLDWNTVDGIVQTELQSTYESLKQDMLNRADGRGFAIFDIDEAKDIGEIAEHLYCLERVMKYYGVAV